MAEERRPGDGLGHRFGFAAFKKMRKLNNTVQEDEGLPPQVSCPPLFSVSYLTVNLAGLPSTTI